MAFAACHLMLDLSALPSQSDELLVGFGRGVGNNRKPVLLIYSANDTDKASIAEPVRYTVYMTLRLSDGAQAGDLGQLVVTRGRVIGMMTHGSAAGASLDESAGSVYAFALDRDDIGSAELRTKWTGRVAGVVIRSRPDLDPGFMLEVTSVMGVLADSGRLTAGGSFADLLKSVTPAAS